MKLLVFRIFTVEQEERIDKQRQIIDKRDVESAVIIYIVGSHAKKVIEESAHSGAACP